MKNFSVSGHYKSPPYKQALAVLIFCALSIGLAKVFNKGGEIEWIIICVGIVFFSWINPLLSIFQTKWMPYLLQSALLFAVLIISLLYLGKFTSPDKLSEHREYQILIPLSILFFILTSVIAQLIKAVYNLAEKNG